MRVGRARVEAVERVRMGAKLATCNQAAPDIIAEACARNLPAELHIQQSDGDVVTAWARMLGWQNERVQLDQPQTGSGSITLSPHQRVTVFLHVKGKRCRFHSAVVEPRARIRLNERIVVTGIALAWPSELVEAQRREDFRVSVAGTHDIPVRFHGLTVPAPGPVPLDVPRFCGRMIDVSAGGMAVLIARTELRAVQLGELFYGEFTLPEDDRPLTPVCQARHANLVRTDTTHLVGMQFVPWVGCSAQLMTQRTRRVVIAEQRRQLRRRR